MGNDRVPMRPTLSQIITIINSEQNRTDKYLKALESDQKWVESGGESTRKRREHPWVRLLLF